MTEKFTHSNVRSSYSIDRQLEPDFSQVRLSGRLLTVSPKPVQPRLDDEGAVVELSCAGQKMSKLNVNRLRG